VTESTPRNEAVGIGQPGAVAGRAGAVSHRPASPSPSVQAHPGTPAGGHESGRDARRLRIAFVYDALFPYQRGGAERRYDELARRLADRHEVHIFTWSHWGPRRTIVREGVRLHGVGKPPDFYGGDGKRTIREAVGFATRLLPALARQRFDVIDCSATPYLPLYSCWLAARLSGSPLIATWHEFWGPYWMTYLPRRRLVARAARTLEAGGVRLGGTRIAVSGFTADRIAATGRVDRPVVVPNGVSLAAIGAIPVASDASDLVFVGRLIDDKRVDLILESVALLRREFPDLQCRIIGDGPERGRLERRTQQLGIRTQVRFAGTLDEAAAMGLMKASRILVLPSAREGFGIVVLEAMAGGLAPVVAAGPETAAPGLITDGVDGLVFEPTADALAAAIAGLLRDPHRLARLRAQAAQNVLEWDWDRRALQLEAVYQQVAARARPATADPAPTP
jgi:glycosyltransferase involved in cell wall biosynthesis